MAFQRWILAVSLSSIGFGAAACNSESPGQGDAGPPGGDGAVEARPGKVGCDTSAQKCPAGMTCDITCVGGETQIACRPVGQTPIARGGACGGQLTQPCALGTSCLNGTTMNGAHCIAFCATDADCPGTSCQERPVGLRCSATNGPNFMVKVCLP